MVGNDAQHFGKEFSEWKAFKFAAQERFGMCAINPFSWSTTGNLAEAILFGQALQSTRGEPVEYARGTVFCIKM